MTLDEYLALMQFPKEWRLWNLLPEDFAREQMSLYVPGNEQASEHDRHGVFQWWLRRKPSADVLVRLAHLAWLDPDPPMAGHVRECIGAQPHCDADVRLALNTRYERA